MAKFIIGVVLGLFMGTATNVYLEQALPDLASRQAGPSQRTATRCCTLIFPSPSAVVRWTA